MSQLGYGGADVIAEGDIQVVVPLTGASITVLQSYVSVVPAGTLAALTFVLPTNPVNGQIVRVFSTQILTAVTVTAGTGDLVNTTPTTVAAALGGFGLMYNLNASADGSKVARTWYRIF